ncbi:MAG: hypothetical protein EAZ37_11295 [Burkholderiales bacterium]|nr:MAG: hypothetical protein EAZ37_11295 [Burkholderiales bacterium]
MPTLITDQQQEARELLQALAVQAMSASERAAWWRSELAAVQTHTQLFMNRFPTQPGAMSFASLAEKNRHDEERELEQAMNHAQIPHASHAASAY